jgi:acetoin utilization protein AcuB
MRVRDVMQTEVVMVTPGTTLPELTNLALRRGIRHLPVVDGAALCGIISDRDIKQAAASLAAARAGATYWECLQQLTAADVMTRGVVTVEPSLPIEEAARIMVVERISALPVIEAGRVAGIVTETDLLRLFVRTLGAGVHTSRLDIAVTGGRSLAQAIQILEDAGAPVTSAAMLPGPDGRRLAVVRIATSDPAAALRALESHGFTATLTWQG